MSRFVVPIAGLVVVGLGVVLMVLRRSLVAVQINGSSMEPTYRSGDRVLVRRRSGGVRVGEVVVIERPGSSGGWPTPPHDGDLHRRAWIIKRVVAAAGDPVPPEVAPALPAGAGATVPEGMVVVLGDAPGRSLDSRYIGFVPVGRILGTALRRLPT